MTVTVLNIILKMAIIERFGSQVRFSLAIGIRENRLSRIVNGWARPTVTEQCAIAAALGRSVEDLFGAKQTEETRIAPVFSPETAELHTAATAHRRDLEEQG